MASHPRWLVVSALAAIAVYAVLWIGFAQQWAWLTNVDSAALDAFYRIGQDNPGWVRGWDIFCTVLGPGAFRLVTIPLIVVAFVRRQIRIAIFLIISVEFAGLVTEIAKAIADRPRPDTAFVHALGTAFPSGHALGVLVAVLAWLAVGLPLVRAAARAWLIALGVVVIVMIGLGRVVLNVHHPSDVLAGWCLGYAFFVFCLLVVPPRRSIRARDETPEAPGISR
ncbi:phosphatase PAP2 family protein [Mycolicibacterium celeriflavum]|uniref:phosphatase PAP2 family protein n=1 Tax=Mycolicibacterium celeriflavum TaxID=1249101 RepID=UPI003CF3D0F5